VFGLDYEISYFFAALNGRVPDFDLFMLTLSANSLLKGGVIAAFLWFAWFAEMGKASRMRVRAKDDRLTILRVLVSCGVAELLSRLISHTLPFRPRPLFDSSLPFKLPDGVTLESLNIAQESSFPSDHAVLFFAMATGIWLVSRRASVLCFVWVTVAIAFPRLYLGLHYLSDLLCGAILGVAVAIIAARAVPHSQLLKSAVMYSRTHRAYFYPLFFLAMHQIANMLVDLRDLGAMAKTIFEVS
jgi:undecaprenyl-diphosphatase